MEEGKRERGLGEAWGKDGRRAESKHQEKAGRTLLPLQQHLALGGLHSRMQVAGDLLGPTVNEQTGVLQTNLPENIRGPSGNLGSKSLWTPSEMGSEEALPGWLLGSDGCLPPFPPPHKPLCMARPLSWDHLQHWAVGPCTISHELSASPVRAQPQGWRQPGQGWKPRTPSEALPLSSSMS